MVNQSPSQPTLGEQIVSLKRVLFRLVTRQLSAHTDRPLMQLRLLRVVAHGDAPSQAEVAEQMLLDAAAVCRIADRLEQDGLLVKREGRDRRSLRLEVTEAALPLVRAVDETHAWVEQQALSHLSAPELDTLQALLGKLQAALNETLQPPRSR